MFPIKYIDNNLVWNKDNEVFAYYELIPYNYSFLSAEQKFIVHDSFRQLIAQSREGKIHALQIATESSIRSMQEQSKKLVTGKLKEVACQKIDEQTEALVSMIGDNQVDYRFFLGFKLMVTEEQLNLKNIKKSAWLTFKEFLHEVNHTLMNDFVSMPNDEINRYMKMEKLLENKISRRFKVRRLEINDFGYLMEHLYGRDGIAYEDYEYQLPKKKLNKETLIKYYDLIRPTRCVIEESQRYLRLEHGDKESYVSYFTVNAIVGELDFPSSEIFYFQQQQFTFPVDTSMNVEIVENRKALTTVRNKKKELKDLDNHAYQAGSETSSNVVDALDSVDELETDLDQGKESMYKLSYVIRVSAPDLDELKRRCDEVKDFYDDLNVKLVRPAGDSHGSMVGAGTGAMAGSLLSSNTENKRNRTNTQPQRNNTSMGSKAGSKVGAVLDTKNKVKDKANAVKENIKDMPTQTAYAVYSAKEKAKSSVSDFKRGMVQEQQSRQTGRLEKQEQRKKNIADKRMELQKAQEARQARKTDGSATTGATRPHERPATTSIIPKPSAEKTKEVKRPATATTSKASEPVKTTVIKERPLSSGASDRKATQSAQPVHRQNVEKVVSQETRQNYTKDRRTKVQQTQTTEKNRNLVTKKGQKKK